MFIKEFLTTKIKRLVISWIASLLFVTTVYAMPPHPLIYDTGPLPKELQALVTKPRLPVPQMKPESVAQRVATKGTAKVVGLLIEFTDTTHSDTHSKTYFDNLLFSQGLGYYSMYDYYKEVSDGQFTVTGTTGVNWYRSSRAMSFYGADGGGVDDLYGLISNLVVEAVQKAEDDIDFSQYDTDGDGIVDHVIVIHAGRAQEDTGVTNNIWSHHYFVEYNGDTRGYLTKWGVYIKNYTMLSEYSPVGVFAHEFGHDLELPDLYNTISGEAVFGNWDLMDAGAWLGPGMSGTYPAHIGAWGKVRLGWAMATSMSEKKTGVQVLTGGPASVYQISLPTSDNPVKEYFLLEYRKREKFDSYLPGEGLLIWHIDDSILDYQTSDSTGQTGTAFDLNLINSWPAVPRVAVDVSQADQNGIINQSSDIFPGSKNITNFISPQTNAYNGKKSQFSVLNISNPGASFVTLDYFQNIFDQSFAISKIYNYPNPSAGGQTKIRVVTTSLAGNQNIWLKIYDLSGELIRDVKADDIYPVSFADNEVIYEYSWNGKNDSGEKVGSGIYLYLFKVENLKKIGKLAIMR